MTKQIDFEKTITGLGRKRGEPKDVCERIHSDINDYLNRQQKDRHFALDPCKTEKDSCPCSTPVGGQKPVVDLVVLIDTSGSMSSKGGAISRVADRAIKAAQSKCPTDLRISWFGIQGTFSGSNFSQTHRNYINSLGLSPAPVFYSDTTGRGTNEEGADATADIAKYFDWRENACRAIFYISDEPMDQGEPQSGADDAATANSIIVCKSQNVTVFTHLVQGGFHNNPGTIKNFTDLAEQTGGKATIGGLGDEAQYMTLLQDIVCNACGGCKEVDMPDLIPCISVSWGDGKCDNLETDDLETLSISVCNCYSNVTFTNFEIGYIWISDANGKPVTILPDGTPSVQALPLGPFCFGDIESCEKGEASCVTREFVISSRGAKDGKYKLNIGGICYGVTTNYLKSKCFALELCRS